MHCISPACGRRQCTRHAGLRPDVGSAELRVVRRRGRARGARLKRHTPRRVVWGSSSWSRPCARNGGAESRRSLPAWSDGPSVSFPEHSRSLQSPDFPAQASWPRTSNRSPLQHRWWRSGLRCQSGNQMVNSGPRLNRPLTPGPLLPAGAVPGLFLQRQCTLVTYSGSMPSPNSSLQRTPARVEYIASRRPSAAGNVLATSAFGRTLGPLSSGR